ncbi:MAG: ParB N-terminal domain-containing protein, partial [Thermoplasmata archaeon]|nr:ParB N-terminal domain-containing protein [Thermoplasmata archaeon]
MSDGRTFRLVPLRDLKEHEEVDPKKVEALVAEIRAGQTVDDPIWVAVGSGVILNGHHRVAALRRLGAARAPAWLIDYHSPTVRLERWTEGPPIPKTEVEQRAARGDLFPPQTTRHILVEPPPRRT